MTSAFHAQAPRMVRISSLVRMFLAESPLYCRLNTPAISFYPSMVLDYSRDAKPNYHSKEEEEDEILLFPLSQVGGYGEKDDILSLLK